MRLTCPTKNRLRNEACLRGHYRKFREHCKVGAVKGVDSLNAARLHGRDDLQVVYVGTRDRVTLQKHHPSRNRTGRGRQHVQAGERQQRRNYA